MQALVDRQCIVDLLAQYCERLDEYDIAGVGLLFLEDGVMDQGPGRGGPIRGRQAIVTGMLERQAKFRRTCHQLGQSVLDIGENEAAGVTYVNAWHQTWDGEVQTVRLRYRDRLVRIPGGEWRIAERVSQAMGVEGFGEAQWNWVPRRAASQNTF